MSSSDLSFQQILQYFKDNGGSVRNRDAVTTFRSFLTDPATKDDARRKFKEYVNTLAQPKVINGEKYLFLRSRFLNTDQHRSSLSSPGRAPPLPQFDPRNSIGIPISPSHSIASPHSSQDFSSPTLRQPPPYRSPPPVLGSPSQSSLDSCSISSLNMSSEIATTPQPPPRRKSTDKHKFVDEEANSLSVEDGSGEPVSPNRKSLRLGQKEEIGTLDREPISVKERTQKFNRMASTDEDTGCSPRHHKTSEKNKTEGVDEDDGASVTSLEPKKCVEWYVTASKGDYQELLKLAKDEPRLVNKKDPFTAYTVLHWGAKHGNPEIIKVFAGTFKVDVNSRTNGGYTPLHIAAQFGHKSIFKLLIEVYKANSNLRDYSGRTPEFYLLAKEQIDPKNNLRKIKGRKKQSEKDLGFLRMGSLNIRVKKTTEAFSNFLGVGSGSINPLDTISDKIHKGWGSADNVNQENEMPAPKGYSVKRKSKRPNESPTSISSPNTPHQPSKDFQQFGPTNDSDSDTAAGFDCQWKN